MTLPAPVHGAVPDLVTSACAAFGLDGATATPLAGERTLNLRVETGARTAVLKLHSPDDAADVALETAALHRLSGVDGVPRVLTTPDGRSAVTVGAGPDARLVRLLSWLPGMPWSQAGPADAARLGELGRLVARVDAALAGLAHPQAGRRLRWNLTEAASARELLDAVPDRGRRALASRVLDQHAAVVASSLAALPTQLIHNDANDGNVLVDGAGRVTGLIDFGDLCTAPRVCGLAVACAYAMIAPAQAGLDPVRAVLPLVAGYHAEQPLTPAELALLLDLVRSRLAVSTCMAGWQHARDPGNAYLLTSQDGVAALLARLVEDRSDLAHYRFREACGFEPVPHARAVRAFLATTDPAPVLLGRPLSEVDRRTLDWSAGAVDAAGGQTAVQPTAVAEAAVGVGRYLEDRDVYTTAAFATGAPDGERRTVHLGVDLFVPAGTAVSAPLAGAVHAFGDNAAPLDYGPVIVLAHETAYGATFFTLYGHLGATSLVGLQVGRKVAAGERFAVVGTREENGGWPPHLHLQLLTDLVGLGLDVPGVAARSDTGVWESLSPDPNLLLGLPEGVRAEPGLRTAEIARRRATALSPALSLSYASPLHIVRGEGAYLYDADGRGWLDLVNNVAHVGHCHPRVVAAAAAQQAVLNTNTRYLHETVVEYARRLTGTLPDPLSVCFFVNSGSEANDLALRLAYAHTWARDVLVLDHAYHGNLTSLVDVSPYKFAGPGGRGRPDRTHVVPLPDPYRGRFRTAPGEPSATVTPAYLAEVDGLLDALAAAGRRPAAFLAEPLPGTAGQVVLADGFLSGAYRRVRAAGGLCIADEVQIGFGRLGSHLWGFEQHGVVPDVVTMGKPIGNGHPLGAVVTTPEVARSFLTGMEYFNTFGGNPVSAAVGLAVLDVVADERLQQRARRLGARMLVGLRELAERHPLVGDVRGAGLFVGVELVEDRESRAPAAAAAGALVEEVKGRGVLVSSDGPDHNVIKIKPPLVLADEDVERFLTVMDEALAAVGPGVPRRV